MDSSPIGSEDEQTFLLIRLPKETAERCQQGSSKVGSVFVYDDGQMEFQDDKSLKIYDLMRNSGPTQKLSTSFRQDTSQMCTASEKSDLFKISLQKEEALHLGKVTTNSLFCIAKDIASGDFQK